MKRSMEEIERYVLLQMTDEDREAFDLDLATSESLQKEVEKFKLIMDASELAVEDKLRGKLQKLASEEATEKKPKRRWLYLAVAAGVAILLGVGLWLGRSPSLQTYASEHYFKHEGINIRSTSSDNIYAEGIKYISQNNWDEAVNWFESYWQSHPNNFEAKFILADIYHDRKNYSAAVKAYRTIIDQNSARWKERAEWNLICTSLQSAWSEDARDILRQIGDNPGHSFYREAMFVAKKLK